MLVRGEAADFQLTDTFLALRQCRLGFALIAVMLDGSLVFGSELFTEIFRTPSPQIKKRADGDRDDDDGKNDEGGGVHFGRVSSSSIVVFESGTDTGLIFRNRFVAHSPVRLPETRKEFGALVENNPTCVGPF